MPDTTLENRLAVIEAAITDLRHRLGPTAGWLEQVVGSQAGEPAFDEVLALGREFRDADRPRGGAPA